MIEEEVKGPVAAQPEQAYLDAREQEEEQEDIDLSPKASQHNLKLIDKKSNALRRKKIAS